MFNKKKQNKSNERLETLATTSEGSLVLKKYLNQIQQLSGVTQADFKLLYEQSITRYFDYLSEPNQPVESELLVNKLNPVVLALKRRRGYLLPLGADSEVIFREREEWTFSVFSAALLNQCSSTVRQSLAKALLPKQGYDWLQRNERLFALWSAYLDSNSANNIFSEIVEEDPAVVPEISLPQEQKTQVSAELAIQKATITEPAVSTQEEGKEEKIKSSEKYALPNDIKAIKEINLSTLNTPSAKANETPQVSSEAQQDVPKFEAATFWNWLKKSLLEEQIDINQPESIVQSIKEGLLICIPEAVDAFIQEKAKQRGFSADHAIWLKRPGLTKKIKKHEKLIKNEQGSRIHTYYWGRWEDRNTLSGIVISASDLLGNNKTIPINENLSIDLLNT